MMFEMPDSTRAFQNPFAPARPVSIPPKKAQRCVVPSDNISALLEQTRIPARHAKNVRKPSHNSNLPDTPSSSPRHRPRRQDSLFDLDPSTPSSQSVPGSYSFLLTPPNSMPDLSRSYSTTSIESSLSTSSSQYSKSPRRLSVQREEVDFGSEDPLCNEDEQSFEAQSLSTSLPDTPVRRRSSLGLLLKPLKAVAPSIKPSSMVSALSANLSAWASSLAATQFDERYGLLPNTSYMHPIGARSYTIPESIPRPVKSSGPQQEHSTIIEAEMERPLLAAHDVPQPIYVELQSWSKLICKNVVVAAECTSRPREPRLNPDFLRILVLETNMRRLGKISAGTGRARMILSPRMDEPRPSQLRCS